MRDERTIVIGSTSPRQDQNCSVGITSRLYLRPILLHSEVRMDVFNYKNVQVGKNNVVSAFPKLLISV